MEKVKVSFEDSVFIVEVEGKKLRVSYKQAELPFKKGSGVLQGEWRGR